MNRVREDNEILPDYVDEGEGFVVKGDPYDLAMLEEGMVTPQELGIEQAPAQELKPGLVTMQLKDFGGNLAMPHFGFSRPSADYFNSNLILHNFIIADISTDINYVMWHDKK